MTDHKSKWWTRMIDKHGSEEAVREFMRNSGNKADRTTERGFAVMKKNNPELLSKISKEASRVRWGSSKTKQHNN